MAQRLSHSSRPGLSIGAGEQDCCQSRGRGEKGSAPGRPMGVSSRRFKPASTRPQPRLLAKATTERQTRDPSRAPLRAGRQPTGPSAYPEAEHSVPFVVTSFAAGIVTTLAFGILRRRPAESTHREERQRQLSTREDVSYRRSCRGLAERQREARIAGRYRRPLKKQVERIVRVGDTADDWSDPAESRMPQHLISRQRALFPSDGQPLR